MPKPISNELPQRIRELIQLKGYRDLADLARGAGLPAQTVRHFFVGSTHRPLLNYIALADAAGLDLQEFANLLYSDRFSEYLYEKGWTAKELAVRSGVSEGTISRIKNGIIKGQPLESCLHICRQLEIPPKELLAEIA